MNSEKVLGDLLRGENMISVLSVLEVVTGEIRPANLSPMKDYKNNSYPDMIISSSIP